MRGCGVSPREEQQQVIPVEPRGPDVVLTQIVLKDALPSRNISLTSPTVGDKSLSKMHLSNSPVFMVLCFCKYLHVKEFGQKNILCAPLHFAVLL